MQQPRTQDALCTGWPDEVLRVARPHGIVAVCFQNDERRDSSAFTRPLEDFATKEDEVRARRICPSNGLRALVERFDIEPFPDFSAK